MPIFCVSDVLTNFADAAAATRLVQNATQSFHDSVSKVCIDGERILVTVPESKESGPIQTALSELGTVTPEVGAGIPIALKKKAKLTFATGSGGEAPMCEPTASHEAPVSAWTKIAVVQAMETIPLQPVCVRGRLSFITGRDDAHTGKGPRARWTLVGEDDASIDVFSFDVTESLAKQLLQHFLRFDVLIFKAVAVQKKWGATDGAKELRFTTHSSFRSVLEVDCIPYPELPSIQPLQKILSEELESGGHNLSLIHI